MQTNFVKLVFNVTDDCSFFSQQVSVLLLQYIMWILVLPCADLESIRRVYFLKPFSLMSNLLPTSRSMWTWKKRKSSATGESDRLPQPPRWRLAPVYGGQLCQAPARHGTHVEGKSPPPGDTDGTKPSPDPRLSASLTHFDPVPLLTTGASGEIDDSFMRKCNVVAILAGTWANEFTLHRHTHSEAEESKTRWNNKSDKNVEASPLSQKNQQKYRCQKRDGWMRRSAESEVSVINLRKTWFGCDNTVGAKTSICKCSQILSVKARVMILSLSYLCIYYMWGFYDHGVFLHT